MCVRTKTKKEKHRMYIRSCYLFWSYSYVILSLIIDRNDNWCHIICVVNFKQLFQNCAIFIKLFWCIDKLNWSCNHNNILYVNNSLKKNCTSSFCFAVRKHYFDMLYGWNYEFIYKLKSYNNKALTL